VAHGGDGRPDRDGVSLATPNGLGAVGDLGGGGDGRGVRRISLRRGHDRRRGVRRNVCRPGVATFSTHSSHLSAIPSMFSHVARSLLVVGLLSAPAVVASQAIPTLPSPAQAQQLLQNNPSLLARLQQMISSSGLSPDEIRSRLKAQGYPESLLDQYLP